MILMIIYVYMQHVIGNNFVDEVSKNETGGAGKDTFTWDDAT